MGVSNIVRTSLATAACCAVALPAFAQAPGPQSIVRVCADRASGAVTVWLIESSGVPRWDRASLNWLEEQGMQGFQRLSDSHAAEDGDCKRVVVEWSGDPGVVPSAIPNPGAIAPDADAPDRAPD